LLARFRSIGIGASIGFALNLYQEKIYHKACRKSPDGKAEPEVRLWMGSVGALIFPIGIFIYVRISISVSSTDDS
jgi:hypothetical protein